MSNRKSARKRPAYRWAGPLALLALLVLLPGIVPATASTPRATPPSGGIVSAYDPPLVLNPPAAPVEGHIPVGPRIPCAVPGSYATIALALADGTCDPINVAAGTYPENLTVNRDVTIIGAGPGATIVDGSGTNSVFTVGTAGINLVLEELTIQNGDAGGPGGGGIANQINPGTLTIQNCEILNNTAPEGGGIASSGPLTILNSTIAGNATTGGPGGGIYNQDTLTITSSIMYSNTSDLFGGGIENANGTVWISGSTILNNTAAFDGGGIDTWGSAVVTLINSTLQGNSTGTDGGGICNESTLTIVGSTLSGNSADFNGGGIFNNGTINILNSTLSGNEAQADGGAILQGMIPQLGQFTPVSVEGSPKLASAADRPAQVVGVTLDYTTIVNNIADSDANGFGTGGGISVTMGTITTSNTILAGNQDLSPSGEDDCAYVGGTTTSGGYNLLGDGCAFGGGTDISTTTPMLGALGDNGGNTWTHLPQPASPAVNWIPGGTNGCGTTVTDDQRDYPRPVNVSCDVGAVELQAITLGDFVWYDTNQNGIQDGSTPGVDAITVDLYDNGTCAGAAIDTTLTDANGAYTFSVSAGTYCLDFSLPAGWLFSPQDQGGDDTQDSDADPATGQITNLVITTTDDLDEDVGMYADGQIGDRVFCDADGDATYDPGEGMISVTVNLYEDPDCMGWPGLLIDTMESGIDGYYLFTEVENPGPGAWGFCYVVGVDTVDPDLGNCIVPVTPISYTMQLNADAPTVYDADFGFEQPQVTLGDFVWYDTNQDGIQDGWEDGVVGVSVDLYDNGTCAGAAISTTVTDANGAYTFSTSAGTYCLEFSLPAGWLFSPQDQGGDDTQDSDADPTTGQINNIVISTTDDLDKDVGMYADGQIGDRVFCDGDGDATYDPGEGMISITVHLYDDPDCVGWIGGPPIDTTESGIDGYYLFTGVETSPPGTDGFCYIVGVDTVDPDLGNCIVPVTPVSYTMQLNADAPTVYDADFGFEQLPELGDFVWYDTNQDGIQDAGEPGVAGIDVELFMGPCGAQPIDMTTTDANGLYTFTGLFSATYCIQFSNIPAGWIISPQDQGADDTIDSDADPATGQINNINLSTDDYTQDMGLYAGGSAGDTVWCDTDGNNTYDPGEGVAGVTLSLYDDPECDAVANGLLATQDTTGDGQYLFGNLAVGPAGSPVCYVVEVDVADMGACNNPITPISQAASLDTNAPDDLGIDFGFNQVLNLGDYVWYDTNQDGIQDVGEAGVQGITVDLYTVDCSGQPITSTTTDASGNYLFTDLASTMYCIQFGNIPAGWIISPQDQGADDTLDSDADPATGQIANIGLDASTLDEDMGLYAEGSAGDTVWCDANYDGLYDPGEGVAGVTVSLYDDPGCDGVAVNPLATQDTVGDGQYLFSDLPVGPAGSPVCYVVDVDVADMGACNNPITPISYAVSLDTSAPDDLDNDFGFSQLLSLGNWVWDDTDQDGVQDAGELGIQDISVDLYDNGTCAGAPIASDTTDAAGDYGFTGLTSGSYCLQFGNLPAGWFITLQDQGGDDSIDSDADPVTGQIANINLSASDLDEDVGLYYDPTPVELLYFRLGEVSVQAIILEWATAVEIDCFGFNLYRAPTPELADASLLAFVPSQAEDGGFSYTYHDVVPTGGSWWYWLADVDTSGQETFLGQVAAGFYQVYLPLVLNP